MKKTNKNAKGLIQNKVIYFDESMKRRKRIRLEQFYKVLRMLVTDEVEVPIFEEQDVKIKFLLLAFDENGDEDDKI